MEFKQQIRIDQRNGNLHIEVDGTFSPDTAAKLATLITRSYEGTGNIFIHTKRITEVAMGSKFALNSLIEICDLPSENIYFIGEKGFLLGDNAAKVIIRKKTKGHRCSGKCNTCKCSTKEAA